MFSARLTWKYLFLLPLFLLALNLAGGKAEAVTAAQGKECLGMDDVDGIMELGLYGDVPEKSYQQLDRILARAKEEKFFSLINTKYSGDFCPEIVEIAQDESKSSRFRAQWAQKIEASRPIKPSSLLTDKSKFAEFANVLSRYYEVDADLVLTLEVRGLHKREKLPWSLSGAHNAYRIKTQTIDNVDYRYYVECYIDNDSLPADRESSRVREYIRLVREVSGRLCDYIEYKAIFAMALDKQGIPRSDDYTLEIKTSSKPELGQLKNIGKVRAKEGYRVWIGPYPVRAQREGRQGTTMIRMMLGPDPMDNSNYIAFTCETARSSGHDDLDEASCGAWMFQNVFEKPAGLSRKKPYFIAVTGMGWVLSDVLPEVGP